MVSLQNVKEQLLADIHRLDLNDKKFFLACSGGKDSMLLAFLFKELKLNFTILHCNFNLRGTESDGDEMFVKQWGEENQIRVDVKHFDTDAFKKKHQLSTQEAARNLRYDFFNDRIEREGNTILVTAHHLEDKWESTLINLSRGTGIQGLFNMEILKGSLFRPLLRYDTKIIIDLIKECNVQFRTDSSNLSNDYKRNYIRNEITPLMTQNDPYFFHKLKSSYRNLDMDLSFFNASMEQWKQHYLSELQTGDFKVEISKQDFFIKGLPVFLRSLGANDTILQEVLTALENKKSGQEWMFSKTLLSLKTQKMLLIGIKELPDNGLFSAEELLKHFPYWEDEVLQKLKEGSKKGQNFEIQDWNEQNIVWEGKVRTSKKIRKMLKDKNVPRYVRSNLKVLCFQGSFYLEANWRYFY